MYDTVTNVNEDGIVKAYHPTITCEGKQRGGKFVRDVVARAPQNSTFNVPADSIVAIRPPKSTGSWSAIKKSGAVRMTPYSTGKTETKFFVSSVERASIDMSIPAEYCGDIMTDATYVSEARWTQNFGLQQVSNLPMFSSSIDMKTNEVDNAKLSAVSDLFSDYYLGEDLVEFGKTVQTAQMLFSKIRRPLKTYRETVSVIKKRRLNPIEQEKLIGDAWMTFRYGIMPIVYSLQDVIGLYQSRNASVKTNRTRVAADLISGEPRGEAKSYLYENISGSVTTSITAKAVWPSSAKMMSDSVSANPIITAYQVLPLSWVLDWFYDVESLLTARLGLLTTSAQSIGCCVAVKSSYTVDTYCKLFIDDTVTTDGMTHGNGRPVQDSYTGGVSSHDDHLLKSVTVDTYDRMPFSPSSVKPSFTSNMNWKRSLDATHLSLNFIRGALRSLL